MIAVIVDDFTGAAELAGISLRFGLTVELCIEEVVSTDTDVLVVSTDSRSLPKEEAISKTRQIVEKVLALSPSWVYKKIDSVLRGYVLEELEVQRQLMKKEKVFILPANPSLGRTIENAVYYIDGKRIHETGFSKDPEFPISNSGISQMLGDPAVKVVHHSDVLPATGVMVGEAASDEDVKKWSDKIGDDFVLAGAGDFYTALLAKSFNTVKRQLPKTEKPFLFIAGSAFDKRKAFVRSVDEKQKCVAYLEADIVNGANAGNQWFDRVHSILTGHNKCIIAIDENKVKGESALTLRNSMAIAVRSVLERENVKELFIEGGSTTASIFRELNITTLVPVDELSRGVVRTKAGDYFISVKPGSYALPKEIEQIFN